MPEVKARDFEHVVIRHRKFKNSDFMLPRRATNKSCGYDIFSPTNTKIKPNETVVIWTDVKTYMLEDEVLEANTRSGNGIKKDIVLANTIGWIDSDYFSNKSNDGNIGIALKNMHDTTFFIDKGDRIAQVKFSKYLVTDTDNPIKDNRTGGIGSSGK